jgi:nucleolar protein 14
LLKEFEERGHAGGVVDRRFGENDPTMSLEERMLQRFTTERQRAAKSSLFNLDDEDELTHYGQSLSKLDDFDDAGVGLDDDDDDEGWCWKTVNFHDSKFSLGAIDADTVKATHFGGFDEEEEEGDDDEVR